MQRRSMSLIVLSAAYALVTAATVNAQSTTTDPVAILATVKVPLAKDLKQAHSRQEAAQTTFDKIAPLAEAYNKAKVERDALATTIRDTLPGKLSAYKTTFETLDTAQKQFEAAKGVDAAPDIKADLIAKKEVAYTQAKDAFEKAHTEFKAFVRNSNVKCGTNIDQCVTHLLAEVAFNQALNGLKTKVQDLKDKLDRATAGAVVADKALEWATGNLAAAKEDVRTAASALAQALEALKVPADIKVETPKELVEQLTAIAKALQGYSENSKKLCKAIEKSTDQKTMVGKLLEQIEALRKQVEELKKPAVPAVPVPSPLPAAPSAIPMAPAATAAMPGPVLYTGSSYLEKICPKNKEVQQVLRKLDNRKLIPKNATFIASRLNSAEVLLSQGGAPEKAVTAVVELGSVLESVTVADNCDNDFTEVYYDEARRLWVIAPIAKPSTKS